ncbi:MAG TPA: hypothetical protein VNJ08_00600 [Bacteriovoracaceae bacterium]|nr:hypothetical protein [Bacteriovoracaceae bacterium]
MKFNKRKDFFINPKFQFSVIANFLALSLITISSFYAANFWFFYKFTQLGKNMGLPADHVFFQFIQTQKDQMNWIFIGVSILVSGILFMGGVLLSHKVAGPIYRLCQHLKAIETGGEVKPITFRKGDYFLEIVDHLNPILEKVVTTKKNDLDKAS